MNIFGPKIISLSVKHPPQLAPLKIREPQPPNSKRTAHGARKSQKNQQQISSPRPSYKLSMLIKDLPISSPRPSVKRPVAFPSPPQSPRSPRQNNINPSKVLLDKVNYMIENPVISPLTEFERKIETLSSINHLVPRIWDGQPSNIPRLLDPLFRMIKMHIFQPLPKFSPFLLYSETKVAVSRQFWPALSIIYKTLAYIIKNTSHQELNNYINQDFIKSLMGVLQSPDANESLASEDCITEIFDKFLRYQVFIFKSAVSLLSSFVDGTINHVSVAPCIRLSHYFLLFNKVDLHSIAFNVVAPLISCHFSSDYFDDLEKIIMFLCDNDPGLNPFFSQYLIAHFPASDSAKSCLFLDLIARLDVKCPNEAFVRLVSDCVMSPNFRVSLAALQVITRNFIQRNPRAARLLVNNVSKARSHWCDMVRDLAQVIYKLLMDADRGAMRAALHLNEREAKKGKEKAQIWKEIFEKSGSDINNIDFVFCL